MLLAGSTELGLGVANYSKVKTVKAENGVLNLAELAWLDQTDVKLDGEWEFYWRQLLTPNDFGQKIAHSQQIVNVPGAWNSYIPDDAAASGMGYGTYRLLIRIPETGQPLALQFNAPRTAHKLWVNGQLASMDGVVTDHAETSKARYYNKIIPLNPVNGTVELVLQVSNYLQYKGGLRQSLILGQQNNLAQAYHLDNAASIFAFGAMATMGLFHISFYCVRRSEKTALYFGLFIAVISVRALTVGNIMLAQLFPELSQSVILRIEYASFYLSILFYTWFVYSLLPTRVPLVFCRGTTLFVLAKLMLVLLTPVWFFSRVLFLFQLFMVFELIYFLIIIIKAYLVKQAMARLLLLSHLTLMVTIGNDALYYAGFINTGDFYPLGILALACMQAVMLMKEFISVLNAVENLNKRLASIDKLKDDFLAEVSHELLTPVHGISGFIEAVRDSANDRLTDFEKRSLGTVLAINWRLVNLVTDIQDFLKLKHRDIELRQEAVHLYEAVEIVIATCRVLTGDKPLLLVNQVDPGIMVWSDKAKLQQILHNLIENAIKFTSAGEIIVSADRGCDAATIQISDTGRGIPLDYQQAIFEPYVQGPREFDHGCKGSGLGLSITKTLVELQGGRIWLKSEEKVGSKFMFTMPLPKQHSFLKREEQAVIEDPNTLSEIADGLFEPAAVVLIVDDEPINLSILEQQLCASHYQVDKAHSGTEALKKISGQAYDLVILDQMLPDIPGYEVCQGIRKRFTPLELPVLILTVRNKADDIVQALATGANDHLAKPFDKRELLARVNSLILMKKYLQEAVDNKRSLLLTQIKPHFFYNVLNTIMGFCITNPPQAYELLGEFSTFISSRLQLAEITHFIELGEEIAVVLSYLKIEKARFGDLLSYEIHCDVPSNFLIPPLILEPLVENAVKHGICEKPDGGCVVVAIKCNGNGIEFTVTDNGIGMDSEQLQALCEGKKGFVGIGLSNVQRRLELDYQQLLHIDSIPGVGTTIRFFIPNIRE